MRRLDLHQHPYPTFQRCSMGIGPAPCEMMRLVRLILLSFIDPSVPRQARSPQGQGALGRGPLGCLCNGTKENPVFWYGTC